ncbi:GNAT family N-acetyltransferase [Methanolobus chelungpuianus]|uniref:Diamine acetyltransferase n=1 Tax=Methanolobus chelungpuianus TaxID=502115 RepID=A0AAE3HAR5_9EURY|nr:GNAT family N-acetyltransferase [Methanolobus chelungpuianus]MCQ6963146.1 diamine acetyltransferase [Methanolobus chelungpuianus]
MSEISDHRLLTIRPATEKDAALIMRFVRALADFENLGGHVVSTEDAIWKCLFGERPYAEAVIADLGEDPAGFAIFFHNFSSFLGRPGLYIEDLFVYPRFRSKGVGKALMRHCARVAADRGCFRMEWSALDWNPARRFYERLGAEAHTEWMIYRLEGKALLELAGADV